MYMKKCHSVLNTLCLPNFIAFETQKILLTPWISLISGLSSDKKINTTDTPCFSLLSGLSSDEEDESCPSSECESRESSAGSTRGTRRLPSIPRPPHTPKTRRAEGRPKRSQYALSPLSLDIPNGHCKC